VSRKKLMMQRKRTIMRMRKMKTQRVALTKKMDQKKKKIRMLERISH
jgi:hypothetical protein